MDKSSSLSSISISEKLPSNRGFSCSNACTFYIDGLYASCVYGFCCGDSGRLCQYHKYRFHTDGTIGNMTGRETNGNEQVLTFFFLWDDGTIGYGVGEPTADFYIPFIFTMYLPSFLRVTVGSCVSPWYMQPYRYHR